MNSIEEIDAEIRRVKTRLRNARNYTPYSRLTEEQKQRNREAVKRCMARKKGAAAGAEVPPAADMDKVKAALKRLGRRVA